MQKLIKLLSFGLSFMIGSMAIAQTALNKFQWQSPKNYSQVYIWPKNKIPNSVTHLKPEYAIKNTHRLIAGKPWTEIFNVSNPTITVFSPKHYNTGVAAIVFPGGGFKGLAIDLEGTEVCNWLTSNGMTCILLKYRVPDSGPAWHQSCHCHIHPKAPTALQDAQRALSIVRYHAKSWKIDPDKIGVIGFSAGGYMVADISSHFNKRAYKPIGAVDKVSIKPDFAIAVYPGHMQTDGKPFSLNPNIHFTHNTPPTLIFQAENDPEDNIDNALLYYIGLKNAGVPVEMHLYARGGHAFGLRPTRYQITRWPKIAKTWLYTIGMFSARSHGDKNHV